LTDERVLDVSLVVPFYNPGPSLRPTIERASATLRASGASFEVIAVSDGSTDGSEASLVGVLPGVLTTVVLDSNRGKGFAVRLGMQRGTGRFVGFLDGDGDIAPEVLSGFVEALEGDPAILFGSKRHPDSVVTVPLARRASSFAYRGLVRLLFHLSVPDTQTGVKLLRADVAAAVLPYMVEERFAFDLELFVIARALGFEPFRELPVRIEKHYSGSISLRSAGSIVWDTLKIHSRFRSRSPIAVGAGNDPERS
jgi:glycosyltransferase involved in cell wall biosynthesis